MDQYDIRKYRRRRIEEERFRRQEQRYYDRRQYDPDARPPRWHDAPYPAPGNDISRW